MQNSLRDNLHALLQTLDNAARQSRRPLPRVLAVSKHQPVTAVAEMASAWRQERPGQVPAFGENYVQEAQAKVAAMATNGTDSRVEWHLIGHLQSNKAALAADLFDWVQTVDSARLATALGRHRDPGRPPLNVLLQVNIDAEPGKHGCEPTDVPALAAGIAAQPRLALRGLMAIPAPFPDPVRRRDAFARMRVLFESLRADHPGIDTLSMGMSDDMDLAIAEGATMVRVGTALFGPRNPQP